MIDSSSSITDDLAESGQTKPGVHIKTFGCQMNEYDTEKMYALLRSTHRPVDSIETADVVIINTCSVREKGEHKLSSTLGILNALKKEKPELVVGISGCVAQQEGERLLKKSRSVDFVIGTHNLSLVPALVAQAQQGAAPTVAVDYRDEWEELEDEFDSVDHAAVPLQSAFFSPVRALVAIQRGCDKRCAFCVVPTTRGPQVSRDPEEILKEIRLKARLGAKEVMLLGQTVNSYGLDLHPRYKFEQLIEKVSQVPGIERIRFTSPHPAEVRKGFLDLYAHIPSLCPHIHLPLQSGNDRILKLMNRNYRVSRYMQIVEDLRKNCADIAITTDIIVGFPTESESDFQDTLRIMREVDYSMSFSFKYSVRPNTVAQSLYAGDELVPDSVAHRRLLELQQLQEELSLKFNRTKLDSVVEILVESESKKITSSMKGRIPHNTPTELIATHGLPKPAVGSLVKARVVRASPYGLAAQQVSEL